MSDFAVTEHEAREMAARIREFWFKRGYYGIRTEVIHSPSGHDARSGYYPSTFGVRSNIGPNGFPPKQDLNDATA